MWSDRKAEEEIQAKQRDQVIKHMKQKEKEREENERKKLLALRRRENEKRTMAVRETLSGKAKRKSVIHEEYNYVPGYSKVLLNQYMNDLVFTAPL